MMILSTFRLLAPASLLALGMASAASAEGDRLVPFVSRAVDGLLLPLDAPLRGALGLEDAPAGVLVLSLRPEGTGQAAGLAPGDILTLVGGVAVTDPLRVDQVVLHGIDAGVTDFAFELVRGAGGADEAAGSGIEAVAAISRPRFWEELEVATAAGWATWEEGAQVIPLQGSEVVAGYRAAESEIIEGLISPEFLAEVGDGPVQASRPAHEVRPAAPSEATAEGTGLSDFGLGAPKATAVSPAPPEATPEASVAPVEMVPAAAPEESAAGSESVPD